jgi:Predicted membrane protein (DUF2254)
LFHALGAFTATFLYALFTLAWVDRGGSAKVPLFSILLVGTMIVASMLLFSRLMQRLGDLQIGNVLHLVGDQGRAVIGEMFRGLDDASAAPHPAKDGASAARLGRVSQTVKYFGKPRTVASLDIDSLVALARQGQGTIVMACAVGDTLVEGTALLHVHDSGAPLPEEALKRAVRLKRERTFEQDPKYPIRLLVDIAIKALSPAINDPTTAVQTIDQLEDLLRRLGAAELDADADLGGLPHPRVRRDPALRLEFGASHAANEGRARRPRGGAAQSRTGGGGGTLSRASRPCRRSLAVRRRGQEDGPPRRPAGHWPVPPQRRDEMNAWDCGHPFQLDDPMSRRLNLSEFGSR